MGWLVAVGKETSRVRGVAASCVTLRSRLPVLVYMCVRESRKIVIDARLPRETQPRNRGDVIEDTGTRRHAEKVSGAKFENGGLF